ncbi:hypothetical protein ACGF8D_24345 [Streptomyces massasporeus]
MTADGQQGDHLSNVASCDRGMQESISSSDDFIVFSAVTLDAAFHQA